MEMVKVSRKYGRVWSKEITCIHGFKKLENGDWRGAQGCRSKLLVTEADMILSTYPNAPFPLAWICLHCGMENVTHVRPDVEARILERLRTKRTYKPDPTPPPEPRILDAVTLEVEPASAVPGVPGGSDE